MLTKLTIDEPTAAGQSISTIADSTADLTADAADANTKRGRRASFLQRRRSEPLFHEEQMRFDGDPIQRFLAAPKQN